MSVSLLSSLSNKLIVFINALIFDYELGLLAGNFANSTNKASESFERESRALTIICKFAVKSPVV